MSNSRQQFKRLFSQAPRLLVAGLCLWASSCSTLDRWASSNGKVPVAPHLSREEQTKKRAEASQIRQAYTEGNEGESKRGAIQPLAHQDQSTQTALAASTNDPFAQAERRRSTAAPVANAARSPQAPARPVTPPSVPVINDADLQAMATARAARPPQARNAEAHRDSEVTPVAAEVPAVDPAPPVANPAFAPPVAAPGFPWAEGGSSPFEGAFCPPVNCPPGVCHPVGQVHVEDASDEYICDGGDAHLPVHYNGFVRQGLDVEDTVVEFTDSEGTARVQATNQVCVYAPRFGSVRSLSAPNVDHQIVRATGSHDRNGAAGFDHRMAIDEQRQRTDSLDLATRSRANMVDQRNGDGLVSQDTKVANQSKVLGLHESFAFFREGEFGRVDPAVIAAGMDAAFDWSQSQPVVIQGHLASGQSVEARAYAQEKVGVEKRGLPASLQIVKLADKKVAASGDLITFTIRFDNLGDEPVRDLRLVDNLSPRLIYVEGSVDSSLPGNLDRLDNGQGSEVLTFTFGDQLAPHAGAWVTFQCKVR